MFIFDRTHPLVEDLAWAPEELRRPWFSPAHVYRDMADGLDWVVDPGDAAYDDAHVRDRLASLRLVDSEPKYVPRVPVGQLLRVEGRVVAEATLEGVTIHRRGVARRLAFRVDGVWWIHEALVDFAIEDEHGMRIAVQAASARLLVHLGPPEQRTSVDFAHTDVPESVRKHFLDSGLREATVRCAERVVAPGETVTIFGCRVGGEADGDGYRDAPGAVALAAGASLPLLIVPSV